MSELSALTRDDLLHHLENSHRYGIGQLSQVFFESLLVAGWSIESIELLADGLRSLSNLERMRKGGDCPG